MPYLEVRCFAVYEVFDLSSQSSIPSSPSSRLLYLRTFSSFRSLRKRNATKSRGVGGGGGGGEKWRLVVENERTSKHRVDSVAEMQLKLFYLPWLICLCCTEHIPGCSPFCHQLRHVRTTPFFPLVARSVAIVSFFRREKGIHVSSIGCFICF